MELILVSDFSPIVNEHLLLNQLFINGLEVFHLRKRDYTLQQMMDYIQAIPAVYHPKIVIHSHFQLLSYFDLKGVHFSKQYTLEHFKNESSEELFFIANAIPNAAVTPIKGAPRTSIILIALITSSRE